MCAWEWNVCSSSVANQCPDFSILMLLAIAYSLTTSVIGVRPRRTSIPIVGVDLILPVIILHAMRWTRLISALFVSFSRQLTHTIAPYVSVITALAAHLLLLHASEDGGRTSHMLRILPLPRYRTKLSRLLYLYIGYYLCIFNFSQVNVEQKEC